MTYEQIKNLSARQFKRFCGVKPQLFEETVGTLRQKNTSLKRKRVVGNNGRYVRKSH